MIVRAQPMPPVASTLLWRRPGAFPVSRFPLRGRPARRRGMGDSCPAGFVMYAPTGTCTETPEFRLQGIAKEYTQAATLGQFGDPPPTQAQLEQMIAAEAAHLCSESFIPCGSGIDAQVNAAAAAYVPPTGPLFYTTSAQQAQTPPNSNQIGGGPALSGSSYPLSATIQNLSPGGSSSQFRLGDSWRLTITGAPNAAVTVQTSHDGQASSANFGSTDGSGRLVLTGSMTPDTAGNWLETWMVGGQVAGQVAFTVAMPVSIADSQTGTPSLDALMAACSAIPFGAAQDACKANARAVAALAALQTKAAGAQNTTTSLPAPPSATPPPPAPATSSSSSPIALPAILTDQYFSGIPNWMLGAGALGLLFAFKG